MWQQSLYLLTGNRGNVSNVNRVVGYSALYGENSINEAFDVIEKKFAKDFKGCTLAELRYDEDVENRFAEEIEKYHKENNQELIVVLSIFDTDEKGGDGGFNPNDTSKADRLNIKICCFGGIFSGSSML